MVEMNQPLRVAGLKFFLDRDGRLFPSYMGGVTAGGTDWQGIFVECFKRWIAGDYNAVMHAPQADQKGTCKLSWTEDTERGKPPAIASAILPQPEPEMKAAAKAYEIQCQEIVRDIADCKQQEIDELKDNNEEQAEQLAYWKAQAEMWEQTARAEQAIIDAYAQQEEQSCTIRPVSSQPPAGEPIAQQAV